MSNSPSKAWPLEIPIASIRLSLSPCHHYSLQVKHVLAFEQLEKVIDFLNQKEEEKIQS